MRSRYLEIVAIVVVASPLLCPWTASGQTNSQSPSSADTLGVACAPNGTLAYNGNSFVLCSSGAWAVDPVTIGTASVAPATCNAAAEGMLYFDTGRSAVNVCTGASWIAVGSAAPIAGGSSTDVQFNNSGVLAGDSGFTYAGANGNVHIAGNLGIGTTVPYEVLDVSGWGNFRTGVFAGTTGNPATTGTSFMALSWDGTNNAGVIQPQQTNTAWRNLELNPNGGNVGIGTTVPLSPLVVRGLANGDFIASAGTFMGAPTVVLGAVNDAENTLEPLYIEASAFDLAGGNVGVGSTSPGTTLDVNGEGHFASVQVGAIASGASVGSYNAVAAIHAGTNENLLFTGPQHASSGNAILAFNDAGTSAGTLELEAGTTILGENGNVGIGSASPQSILDIGGQLSFGISGNQSGTVNRIAANGNAGWITINSPTAIYLNNDSGAPTYIYQSTLEGTTVVSGTLEVAAVEQTSGGYIYPGREDGGGNYQTNWWLGSNATYGLYSNTGLYLSYYLYAPLFYDTANTGYYVEPHAGSRMSSAEFDDTLINWSGYNGIAQAYGNYIWPGRNDGSSANWQQSWYLASNGSYGLYTNTGMYFGGGIYQAQGAYVYPGCDSSCGSGQQSFYLYADNSYGLAINTGLNVAGSVWANGCLYMAGGGQFCNNGDSYLYWAGTWQSNWLNQSVVNGADPTFGNVYLNYGPGWISNWLNQSVANGASPTFGNVYLNYGPGWISNWLNQSVTNGASPTFANLYLTGSLEQNQGVYIYPGCNNSCGNDQTSYYFYSNTSDQAILTNGSFIAGGNLLSDNNIYLGSWGNWLTNILVQYMNAASNYNNGYGGTCGTDGFNGLFTSGETVYLDWASVYTCVYNTTNQILASDARLKTDIMPLPDQAGLSTLIKLKPVTFEWKDAKRAAKEGEQIGFIAQDVEKVYPQFVQTQDNPWIITKADGSKETIEHPKILRYQNLTAPLVKAVQELKIGDDARDQTIAALRARLDEDEREIAELRKERRAQ